MKRSTWISTVDVLAFASFLLLIATGLLIRYVLPPGSGDLEAHGGGGRAAGRPVALVWGLTRHEWGSLHFWLAVLFLVVIALHLFIHWKWILVSFRGRDRRPVGLAGALGIGALQGLVVLAVAMVLGPKEMLPRYELQEQRQGRASSPAATPSPEAHPTTR